MDNITFKQFIYTYNFRYINDIPNQSRGTDWDNDTCTIRIYPPSEEMNNKSNWFEFGVYDFSNKEYTWKICEEVLSEEILTSYVESICYNTDYNKVVTVYLTREYQYID